MNLMESVYMLSLLLSLSMPCIGQDLLQSSLAGPGKEDKWTISLTTTVIVSGPRKELKESIGQIFENRAGSAYYNGNNSSYQNTRSKFTWNIAASRLVSKKVAIGLSLGKLLRYKVSDGYSAEIKYYSQGLFGLFPHTYTLDGGIRIAVEHDVLFFSTDFI